MFRKTRLRIFALIMTAATIIISLMLVVIYKANANYNFERGISLLESYTVSNDFGNGGDRNPDEGLNGSASGGKNGNLNRLNDPHGQFDDRPMEPGERKDNRNKMFRLSTFYSVFYNQDGEAVRIESDGGLLYTEDEILEIANYILDSEKTSGTYNKMPFLVKTGPRGTLVALIDNTKEDDNSGRLFEYSLIAGISGWLLVFVLSWFFTKRIVRPLEENDKKQKQFISNAGHELKTPISVISANAELLSQEVGENKWLSNIQYENERMGNLVKQLLSLVRAENMQQIKEPLDFSQLVTGGALPFESVAYEKGMILNVEVEDGVQVEGNQNELSQLVSILIDNAIEYGEPQKEIFVKLTTVKNHVVFKVINYGEPIPEDVKERMFERFYRMDESRNDESGHYGLGLAIAKAIVTAHNGSIDLKCYDGQVEARVTIPGRSKI